MNFDIKEVLFWIFLILSVILLLWYVFGKSPTEFIATMSVLFAIVLKVWSISDRQIKSEMKFKNLENSFIKLAKDFKEHLNIHK